MFLHAAKVKALSSKQRVHLSRARQAAKDMGFHLKSGAETAVAMRGEVADVMVRVARQLFENDGFNKLCRSLTKEFQKRSSKVRPSVSQQHAPRTRAPHTLVTLHQQQQLWAC